MVEKITRSFSVTETKGIPSGRFGEEGIHQTGTTPSIDEKLTIVRADLKRREKLTVIDWGPDEKGKPIGKKVSVWVIKKH